MEEPKKVFFIVSNQTKLDKEILYCSRKRDKIELHNIITKTVKYKREDFTLKVLYFEIFFSHYSEKETQSFIINLKYNRKVFEGNVETKKNKNHFVLILNLTILKDFWEQHHLLHVLIYQN